MESSLSTIGTQADETEDIVQMVGFVIAEAAWGRGFATELLAGFTHRCRAEGVSSLVGGVEARNSPSRRVLEKCGDNAPEITGKPFNGALLK